MSKYEDERTNNSKKIKKIFCINKILSEAYNIIFHFQIKKKIHDNLLYNFREIKFLKIVFLILNDRTFEFLSWYKNTSFTTFWQAATFCMQDSTHYSWEKRIINKLINFNIPINKTYFKIFKHFINFKIKMIVIKFYLIIFKLN